MKITKRDITKEEHQMIQDDFRAIEVKYGIAPSDTQRLNVTVDDENGKIIGVATGLMYRNKWFYLSDLWIDEKLRIKGNPEFVTILRLLNLFDIKLAAEARK
ncbi:MAG: hypothetical protein FWC83_00405 [Alphaproteobacteria bacterium]|nr:hypothetical protein [Alphaproteobacteria bacterium]